MGSRRRGAKYLRISDDREGLELGVQRQDQDLDRLGERLNIEWVATYVDNDISASPLAKRERPDYKRLLADARAGRFEVIGAATQGRLTRRPREFEDLIDLAMQYGTEFVYDRSPSFNLNTADGRQIARMMAAADAAEAERISERVARAVRQRAEQREYHGGPRGYGITPDGRNIVPEEAAQIRKWAEFILSGGKLHALARALNREGVPSVTGRPWRSTVIRRILINPRTAGIRTLHGAAHPTPHPAILDEEVWRAVRQVLGDPSRRSHHGSTARMHLGVGLYLCDRDDKTVHTGYVRAGARRYRCLACWRIWQADPIDVFVIQMTEAALADEDRVARLLPQPEENGPDLGALRAEAAAITKNLETLAAEFAAAKGAVLAALRKGVEAAEARLAEIERELDAASRIDPAAGVLSAADPVAAFRALDDVSRRQAVIRRLMEVRLGAPPRGRRRWTPECLGPSRWTGDPLTWADHWVKRG
jgi:site-specific DNA recombinase